MTVSTPAGLTLLHGRIDLVLPPGSKILAQPGMRCLAGEAFWLNMQAELSGVISYV